MGGRTSLHLCQESSSLSSLDSKERSLGEEAAPALGMALGDSGHRWQKPSQGLSALPGAPRALDSTCPPPLWATVCTRHQVPTRGGKGCGRTEWAPPRGRGKQGWGLSPCPPCMAYVRAMGDRAEPGLPPDPTRHAPATVVPCGAVAARTGCGTCSRRMNCGNLWMGFTISP